MVRLFLFFCDHSMNEWHTLKWNYLGLKFVSGKWTKICVEILKLTGISTLRRHVHVKLLAIWPPIIRLIMVYAASQANNPTYPYVAYDLQLTVWSSWNKGIPTTTERKGSKHLLSDLPSRRYFVWYFENILKVHIFCTSYRHFCLLNTRNVIFWGKCVLGFSRYLYRP